MSDTAPTAKRALDPLDLAIAVVLFALAAFVRMGVLSVAQVTPDCIGPYLGAYEMMTTGDWLGPSYFPESGPALYWLQVPFLLAAGSLEEVLKRRFLLQALCTPFLYLGMRLALAGLWGEGRIAPARRLAPLLGACALGFSQGPMLSLLSGAEGFVAPDLAALITVAVATTVLAGRDRWLLAAWAVLPFAMMVHGMSAAYGPGLLLLAALAWRRGHRRLGAGAVALGALGFAPRAYQLVRSVMEDGLGTALQAATYNDEGAQFWMEMLTRTVDHVVVRDPLPWGPLLALSPGLLIVALLLAPRLAPGAFTATTRQRGWLFAAWLWSTGGGILIVAVSIGYMQGYHWRILYPAAAASLALAVDLCVQAWHVRRGGPAGGTRGKVLLAVTVGAVMFGSAGLASHRWPARPMETSELGVNARFASVIAQTSGSAKRWHERAAVGSDPWGYAPAMYLEERLSGQPGSYGLDGALYLLFSADESMMEGIEGLPGATLMARARPWNGPPVRLLRFDSPEASVEWSRAVLERAGAQSMWMKAESGEYLPAVSGPVDYADIDAWFSAGMER